MMFLSALEQLKEVRLCVCDSKKIAIALQLIPHELDLCAAYAQGADSDQKFIANLAMFLAAFLKEHASLVEVTPNDRTTGGAAMKQQVQGAHTLVCLCFQFNNYYFVL